MAREELIEFARYVERFLPTRLGALVAQTRKAPGPIVSEALVALAEAVEEPLSDLPLTHSPVDEAIAEARERLLSQQSGDGHWCGELEGDTTLESEYVLLLHSLGRGSSPTAAKACEHLRRKQLETGGWTNYDGGPVDIGGSVKAYFALKLAGDDPGGEPMLRARRAILDNGGIEAVNSFTKILLAIFGQYDWKRCPAVIPELALLPHWFPFNIGDMSAWSRTILVPLSIVWAKKPKLQTPEGRGIEELYAPGRRLPSSLIAVNPKAKSVRAWLWGIFFVLVSGFFNVIEAIGITPLRRRALATAERWILRRLDDSDGLGAIFPPIVNTILALRSLGYADDDPAVVSQIEALERLVIDDGDALRVQPCLSPVWDTGVALHCLLASGMGADDPRMLAAGRWLMERECTRLGDWAAKVPGVQPSGWPFEYRNAFYPDTDDTAQVLTSLAGLRFVPSREEGRRRAAIHRGLDWLLAMQNDDGGFGAFDRGCDKELLTYVPFADHNAMIDPSCEDITGRALETFAKLGLPASHPACVAATRYLLKAQATDGSWYGRWGTNYLYGTWLATWGLTRVALEPAHPAILKAAAWVREVQNTDGGWGESQLSYEVPCAKGLGVSTASQTAWALLTLIASGDVSSPAFAQGIDYLVATQRDDGSWLDAAWTGTGFPRVFYLRYHLYATYFPLLALATYARERT